jgi:predicted dithiol-disulfide oxidoreductase (DUF899 family)
MRRLREDLLAAERELKDRVERVAELRRALPAGTPVASDYVFTEGPADLSDEDEGRFFETRLSALFADGKHEFVVQHMMFAPNWEQGCPMCSMWADGFDGVAHHLNDRVTFAVVARAPLAKLRGWARQRGWRRLRLLSSFESSFNADFGVEISAERQLPALSVFARDESGRVLHTYTTEGSLVEAHHRMLDLYSPVWNVFDLLPGGRGDWMPKHFYHA